MADALRLLSYDGGGPAAIFMSDQPKRHVLVWVDKVFIESEGMLHLLEEAGVLVYNRASRQSGWEKIVEAAENAGGFAISGSMVEDRHAAGIWICPQDESLQIMIPWGVVRTVISAQQPESEKIYGLISGIADRHDKMTGTLTEKN